DKIHYRRPRICRLVGQSGRAATKNLAILRVFVVKAGSNHHEDAMNHAKSFRSKEKIPSSQQRAQSGLATASLCKQAFDVAEKNVLSVIGREEGVLYAREHHRGLIDGDG